MNAEEIRLELERRRNSDRLELERRRNSEEYIEEIIRESKEFVYTQVKEIKSKFLKQNHMPSYPFKYEIDFEIQQGTVEYLMNYELKKLGFTFEGLYRVDYPFNLQHYKAENLKNLKKVITFYLKLDYNSDLCNEINLKMFKIFKKVKINDIFNIEIYSESFEDIIYNVFKLNRIFINYPYNFIGFLRALEENFVCENIFFGFPDESKKYLLFIKSRKKTIKIKIPQPTLSVEEYLEKLQLLDEEIGKIDFEEFSKSNKKQ
jgi:hypothetical protein